ncbi:MAG: lipoate--protein ligase family protein [Planctomycetales bacterium]|nr:lipoate--protein ligase family protein [Planctomycetales bacterium]
MKHLQLTLGTPAENLALDEALLDAAEAREISHCVLRLWEPADYCVILGRSSNTAAEVDLHACRQANVPVLRRSSGGGAIVAGPGCLMYAVILDYANYPQLRAVDLAHKHVLGRLAESLTPRVPSVAFAGTSDLVMQTVDLEAAQIESGLLQKFSGNALRIKRTHFLYHGTLLYDFELPLISKLLVKPSRQPAYRQDRSHAQFVTNLPLDREEIELALIEGWGAHPALSTWPRSRVETLIQNRYDADSNWTLFHPCSDPSSGNPQS